MYARAEGVCVNESSSCFGRGTMAQYGSGGRTRRSFGEMMSVINRGELTGVVGQVFPLQDVARAHQVVESRDFYGKLVIKGP